MTVSSVMQEVSLHNTRDLILKVPFLKRQEGDGRDEIWIGRIAIALHTQHYIAGDYITKQGEAGFDMFFIVSGKVDVFVNDRKVVSFFDGAYLGEVALICTILRTATVQAAIPSMLYRLNCQDFRDILEEFPDMKRRIDLLAEERDAVIKQAEQNRSLKVLGMFETGLLFNSNIPNWKHNRKLLIESVARPRFLRCLAPKINDALTPLLTLLSELDESKTPVLANVLFGSISLDVIIDILFSENRRAAESYLQGLVQQQPPPVDRLLTLVHAVTESTVFFLQTPPLLWKYLPLFRSTVARHKHHIQEWNTLVASMIQEKSDSIPEADNPDSAPQSPVEGQDLVTILCQTKNVSEMWFQDSIQIVKEAIGGGTDTSSNTMSFLTYELARHPAVAEQVFQEICNVAGDDAPLDSTHMDHLPFLEACIYETLRLHSVAQLTTRRLTQDFALSDTIVLKKDAEVFVGIQMTQGMPENWGDALEFRPERFVEERKEKEDGPLGLGFKYAPFGGGIRKCPGEALAMLEMKLVMGSLIRRFKFVLAEPNKQLAVKDSLTLECQELPIFFERR
ncbi:hypothetical protein HDU98_002883 [Podochytrium sp. JEL0797]|nr:hypothetical protein HDU98_002883 [Podochytrium sp. JEL0797]